MNGGEVVLRAVAAGEPGAPLVVLAHGLEDGWTSWLSLARALDPRLRLLALDLPWRPGGDYSWRHRTPGAWLGDGLDLVGERPDVLVAHSLGANAALELLCDRDARIGASTLVSPLYREPRHPVTWQMFDRARATFVQHVRDGLRARLGERADALGAAVVASMMDIAVDRVGPYGFLTVFDRFAASAELPLGRIDAAVTVLAGGADPTLSRAAATALSAAIPGARLLLREDCDHFGHIRHAPAVSAEVAALLATACGAANPTGGRE